MSIAQTSWVLLFFCRVKGIPMGAILPGVIGKVKCHQGKFVQMPIPCLLPAIYNLCVVFQDLFLLRRQPAQPVRMYTCGLIFKITSGTPLTGEDRSIYAFVPAVKNVTHTV